MHIVVLGKEIRTKFDRLVAADVVELYFSHCSWLGHKDIVLCLLCF